MSLLTKNRTGNYPINLVFKLDKSNRGFITNRVGKWKARLGKTTKGDLKCSLSVKLFVKNVLVN